MRGLYIFLAGVAVGVLLSKPTKDPVSGTLLGRKDVEEIISDRVSEYTKYLEGRRLGAIEKQLKSNAYRKWIKTRIASGTIDIHYETYLNCK